MFPRITSLAIAIFIFAIPAAQAEHHWEVLGDDLVKLEILDGGPTKDGNYIGALRLQLADGWKTYWRSPGDAGIPPQISWRGSRNLATSALIWPTPEVFKTAGMRTIGYSDEMILPVILTPKRPGQPVRLKGHIDIGVCREVCIPATLDFDHTADLQADKNPAIAAAIAARPYTAREGNVRSVSCSVAPSKYGVNVTARITMPRIGRHEVAVIESGALNMMTSGDTTSHREGNVIVAQAELMPTTSDAIAIDRSSLRFTVLGDSHAVDIVGCDAG